MTLRREPSESCNADPCLRLSVGDVRVALQGDLRGLLDEARALYPIGSKLPVDTTTIRIDVRKTRSRFFAKRYRVYADGQEIGGERRANEVFPFIEWAINLRVIATQSQYVQLHAASMSHRGYGFVFAGGSGSGKSTLAAGLMARGWDYFCDEFALIDRKTLCLHPFPKPLCIKAGSFPIIERLGLPFSRCRYYIKSQKGRVGYINPHGVVDCSIGSPTPIQFVIFPEYAEKQTPRLHSLSRSRALMDLAGCVFNRHEFDDQALSILHEVVRSAQCFRLETGNIDATCDLLETLLCRGVARAQNETRQTTKVVPHSPRTMVNSDSVFSRRAMLKRGAKLAYVAPTVMALTAQKAFAAGSNPSGMCSTGLDTGELCTSDSDCCSNDCNFGVCN